MQEIEVKILEINRSTVEAALVKMGAEKVFDGEMETFFYDFKDHSIVKAKNVLRLRRENMKVVLTFKKVAGTQEAKIAQEYSVEVSDLGVMQKILEALGVVLMESMKKHRTSYELDGTYFDIDRYHGKYSYVPEFLEIEAESAQEIWRYAEVLGFKNDDCLPWSTKDLISYYSLRSQKVQS